MRLDNQNCVVIGGSSGIGMAIAKAFLQAGGRSTIGGRNLKKLSRAAEQLSEVGQVQARGVDMLDDKSINAFYKPIPNGSLNALVITASDVVHGSFADTAPEDVANMFASKFLGPYRLAQAALPKMVKGGSVTFTSGVLSRRPGKNGAGLAAVNAAIEGLGRALALELGPKLRVNVLSPGMTRTEAYAHMPSSVRDDMFKQVAETLPVGRIAAPEEVAQAALLLMTNGFLTGHVLDIDGGHLIQRG